MRWPWTKRDTAVDVNVEVEKHVRVLVEVTVDRSQAVEAVAEAVKVALTKANE